MSQVVETEVASRGEAVLCQMRRWNHPWFSGPPRAPGRPTDLTASVGWDRQSGVVGHRFRRRQDPC